LTTPAAEVKSVGMHKADVVFVSPLGQFYHDVTTFYHLPGFSNLPTVSGRENSRPFTRTLQKLMPALTQTATPHTHRAVIANANNINNIDNFLTSFLYTATAYLAHLLMCETQPIAQAKAKRAKCHPTI